MREVAKIMIPHVLAITESDISGQRSLAV